MSLEEMFGEGNGIVSSANTFKYFLGKGWSALIYCDPTQRTPSLHRFLGREDGLGRFSF